MNENERDKINIVVVTDGRHDYLERCMDSMNQITGPIGNRFMFEDSGDDQYRARLARSYSEFLIIGDGPRKGFTKTMVDVWKVLAIQPQQWAFHIEGDFTFPEPVKLDEMQQIMISNQHLAQLALLRQPWNREERIAGGYMQLNQHWFTERETNGQCISEHRAFFTTNPHLTRRSVCATGWEDCDQSEGHTSLRLFRQGFPGVPGKRVRSAILGGRDDEPRCIHIGNYREGYGY